MKIHKALYIIFILLLSSCSVEENLKVEDHPIITPVSELANYFDLNLDKTGKYEQTRITRYFDKALDLEYEYDLIETDKYDPLYYSITLEQTATVSEAKEAYMIGKGAINLGGQIADLEAVRIDSLDLPGDESYYALRTYEGQPNGILFTARKGQRVYTLIISGVYWTDHSFMHDVIFPIVEQLTKLRIKNAKI